MRVALRFACAVLIGLEIAVLTAMPAAAQVGGPSNDTMTAAMLDASCFPPKGVDKETLQTAGIVCEMYFRGLTDGLFMSEQFASHKSGGCLPTETPLSNAEAKADFHIWLMAHPEAQKNSAAIVASFGIMQTHPCSAAK